MVYSSSIQFVPFGAVVTSSSLAENAYSAKKELLLENQNIPCESVF